MSAIADPATYQVGVPHAEFARLRREDPVSWVVEPALERHIGSRRMSVRGSGFWAVTRYADVVEVARRPDVFSSAERGTFVSDPMSAGELQATRQFLINMDGARHRQMRQVVSQAFRLGSVEAIRHRIRAHADALFRRAWDLGRFDGVADLAVELPIRVLADLLGVPESDRSLLFEWSTNLVGFDDPEFGAGDVQRYKRTFAEAFAYVADLARARRRAPTGDLVGRLVQARVDGRPLTDAELGSFWLLLVVAGNESTRHLISGGLRSLLERPECLRRLSAHPDLRGRGVEELLRFVTPILQFRRTATRSATLGGREIAAGDKVVLYFASANRDAEVFEEPDALRLDRDPNRHLAFGTGSHWCLGAHLARAEMLALLDAMGSELVRLRLAGPPVRLRSNFMNGHKSLPLARA